MEREELMVETFVMLADTLVDTYDPIDFMQALAERCVELLDISEAGILLAGPDGQLRHVAGSSQGTGLVELFELQVAEGPAFDAYVTRVAVGWDSTESTHERWPRFAPHAHASGFEAVAAVPMRLRSVAIGALSLFSMHRSAPGERDLAIAQAMADIATIGIIQQRELHDLRAFSTQLEATLASRIVIEQAKGIVAERCQLDPDEAFRQMRRFARVHDRLLSEIAGEIVAGDLAPTTLADPRSSPRSSLNS